MVSSVFILSVLFLVYNAAAAAKRPHIVLILADDLGWDDVGFHGSTQIPTPNIDALAYSGLILNNYYVQPICTPTRSALMTGRHPIHLGLQSGVIVGAEKYGLGLNETIMPQYLKELGYSTHIVGKWHLGMFAKEYTPTYRGFDSHFGYWQGMEDYWDHTYCARDCDTKDKIMSSIDIPVEWGLDFRRNMQLVKDCFGQYSTELFTSEAEQIIAKHDKSQPLFLYMAQQAVHSANPWKPLEAPWKYLKNFMHIKHEGRRTFAAMASALDDSVGNITKALHAKGMLQDSIIIFSTDNGGPAAGFNDNYASNWPLRGVKATYWEGGVRGTGFIWSPLLHRRGSVSTDMMHVPDWLPTILHVAGYDMTKLPKNLDGHDMWPTLSQGTPSPRKEILHNIEPKQHRFAVRVGNMKLISGLHYTNYSGWYPPEQIPGENNEMLPNTLLSNEEMTNILSIYGSVPRDIHPVVVKCKHRNTSRPCHPLSRPCLFDINVDPCEYNNIASDHPDIVAQLLDRIRAYNETAVPFKGQPEDPKGFPSQHNGVWEPWVNL